MQAKHEQAWYHAERFLLRGKTWRYLRYLHFRDAILRIHENISSVCVCGSGHGIAETLLAIEFPRISFTLTDIIDRNHGYPNYHRAMDLAWRKDINNMHFSVWNVLEPCNRNFDLVASTEMLEHIEDDKTAAKNMNEVAQKYVYCLVPYADQATNASAVSRKHAWETHEHYVCGYDAQTLTELFPSPIMLSGAYWEHYGQKWRSRMKDMALEQIDQNMERLKREAEMDLIENLPHLKGDCQAIKILSEK